MVWNLLRRIFYMSFGHLLCNLRLPGTQEDAREAKVQLRHYVADFLLWRDRAKGLKSRLEALGHPVTFVDGHGASGTPSSCIPSPSSKSMSARPPLKPQRLEGDRELQPASSSQISQDYDRTVKGQDDNGIGQSDCPNQSLTGDTGGSSTEELIDTQKNEVSGTSIALSTKALRGSTPSNSDDADAELSAPEKYARMFQNRYTPSNGDCREVPSEAMSIGEATGASSAPSRAYFQRSMKSQQEISARLERDLVKARADLQSIYTGTTNVAKYDEARVGLVPEEGFIDRRDVGLGGEGTTLPVETCDGDSKGDNLSSARQTSQCGRELATEENNRELQQANSGNQVNIMGPYMARVLAALLGADELTGVVPDFTTNALAAEGGAKLFHPALPPLRLSDYPPRLQAVFGGTPSFSSPPYVVSEHKAIRARRNGRGNNQKSKVPKQGSVSADGIKVRKGTASESMMKSTLEGRLSSRQSAKNTSAVEFFSTTGKMPRDTISGRSGGRGRQVAKPSEDQVAASGRNAIAGVFREYEAKSPLLQRWLTEMCYSPTAQVDQGT